METADGESELHNEVIMLPRFPHAIVFEVLKRGAPNDRWNWRQVCRAAYHEVSQTVTTLDGKWLGRSSNGYAMGHELQFCLNFNSTMGFAGFLSSFPNLVSIRVDRPFHVPIGSWAGWVIPTLDNLSIFSHAPNLEELRIDHGFRLLTLTFVCGETDDPYVPGVDAPWVDPGEIIEHKNPKLKVLRIGNASSLLSFTGASTHYPCLSTLEVRGVLYRRLDLVGLAGLTALTKLA